ncbi:MAG: hypothetical protein WCR67_06130 [Bacilli bacterium]
MDNKEIYEAILDASGQYNVPEIKPVTDLKQVFRLLVIYQLTEDNLNNLNFYKNEKEIKSVLFDYDYKLILKGKGYADFLKIVLERFNPVKTGDYKKLAMASYHAAKYLIKFSSFDNFVKHIKGRTSDPERVFDFLNEFRKESSLNSIYLVRACTFFQVSGLLNVPVPNKKSKDFLMPLCQFEDDNRLIYKTLLAISKANGISCYELNNRIDHIN